MPEKSAETFEQWKAGFEGLSFMDTARRFRDKILESPELDKISRDYFTDAFGYVTSLVESGRKLDTNLMRIHMMEIKGHSSMSLQDFSRVLMLLSLCGFCFTSVENDKNM